MLEIVLTFVAFGRKSSYRLSWHVQCILCSKDATAVHRNAHHRFDAST